MQVPAYRDRELGSTLHSLYSNAAFPDRLRTIVLWQRDLADDNPSGVDDFPGLTIIEVDAATSRGPNWARHVIQQRADGEEYTLMLDSHMRFVEGWDEMVTGMLDSLHASGVKKPILTAYLPPYLPNTPRPDWGKDPYKIYPLDRDDGVLTRLTSYPIPLWKSLEAPVPGEFFSLHFAFMDSAFNWEVPHDPHIYFFGDEIALGLRAYTFGWDIFHPHRVVGWHAYIRSSRIVHWDEHPEWGEAHRQTVTRLRGMFSGCADYQHLIGSIRTIADYERLTMHELVVPQ
ncbi:GlcNAc-transferase family protein [Nocardia gipuzkoensis]